MAKTKGSTAQVKITFGKRRNGKASIEFFQERFDDFAAGVSIDIEISAPIPLNLCQVPTT